MDNELIKLIKQERPTGRMGNNNEPVWNAAKVYDLMIKAQQQVKSVDLANVGKSVYVVCENDDYGRSLYLDTVSSIEEANEMIKGDSTRHIYTHDIE